jgi:predicted metalloendopeptidase
MSPLLEPTDRLDWPIDQELPITYVQAFYYFEFNMIVLLMGLLDEPFYYKNGPTALNYGAIGMYIGHEMVHA